MLLTYRPELLEGGRTLDRRLVVPGRLQDPVGAAVDIDGANILGGAAGIVGAEGFDNVVLDLRAVSHNYQALF